MSEHLGYMQAAIAMAHQGMAGQHGGPFGAVIVKDGKIIGRGHNRVLSSNDPTAHAEVTAIRDASAAIAHFDLSGAEIYINAMPCPMCLSAIFWARIDRVYYAAEAADAAAIGFDDQKFYEELAKPAHEREVKLTRMTECLDEALGCFQTWADNAAKTPY